VMIGNKRNFPSALVVPNFANLEKWAKEKGIAFASREALAADPRVADLYDRTVKELTRDHAQFEKIKKVAVLPREFSIETGELTPKMSVKRRVVEEKYKDVIDRLYEGPAPPEGVA
jgi:long-chain acyl-CoA synthetase